LLPVYILHSVLVFLYILIGGFPALTHWPVSKLVFSNSVRFPL
jgi:hypothetical protein